MGADFSVTIQQILDSIFRWGPVWVYIVIMVACFIENIIPPFPGDTFIAVAGALVAAGRLDFPLGLIVVCIGGVGSVMVLHHLGHKFGRDYFIEKDYRFFSREDVGRIERLLGRYGVWILVLSRFVVGVRAGFAVAAGIAGYPGRKMLLYSLISYLLFASLVMTLGYLLVDNFPLVRELFQTYNHIVWPIVLIVLAVYVVIIFRRRKRKKA